MQSVQFVATIKIWRIILAQITGTITFTITPAPLAIANTSFSDAVGTVLAGSLGITGGTAPYTVTVNDPQDLPPGVSIDGSGNVTGTPTTAGTFTCTVTVTDATGATASAAVKVAAH